MSETELTIVGRLASDIDMLQTSDGRWRATFRVVSNARRQIPQTGEWVDGRTLFVRVVCWRSLAQNLHASLRKGDPVIVHGSLRMHEYVGRDGKPHSALELDGRAVGPDLALARAAVTRLRYDGSPSRAGTDGADGPEDGAGNGAGNRGPEQRPDDSAADRSEDRPTDRTASAEAAVGV